MTLDDAMAEAEKEEREDADFLAVHDACVELAPVLLLTTDEVRRILEQHDANVVIDGAETLYRLRAVGLGDRAYVEVLAKTIRAFAGEG